MYHAAAKDLYPAFSLTESASFSVALETGYIHLGRRLGKRKMMRPELDFCIFTEKLLGKGL